MGVAGATGLDRRHIDAIEDGGTSPGDRRFRPDVEGLRAVAVVLVVLYHAHIPRVTGGYVGVDVFFVISGFVITGLLLREQDRAGQASLFDFYARRVRRILPAATLVILITVGASYLLLGYVSGNSIANDGRWAAAFLSNFHFANTGTNYLSSAVPPSPLQNYWSLSVEEQFYIVFPSVFLLATVKRITRRIQLGVVLVVVIIASYGLSVAQTASNPTVAYFSPLTRAWELALGGLVAVGYPALRNVNRSVAVVSGWVGIAGIALAAFLFNGSTDYPGSVVAIPVVGTALVIASGSAIPRFGPESVLRRSPFQWIGRRSYSLYLWHWPILIIAAEYLGKSSLSTIQNLLLVAAAVLLSMVTFAFVEQPIRHLRSPPVPTVIAGISLVVATVLVLSLVIVSQSFVRHQYRVVPASSDAVVLRNVASSTRITRVPSSIEPSLSNAVNDYGGYHEPGRCQANFASTSLPICVMGDPRGQRLMVLYGDSHALMWFTPLKRIAAVAHWRLVVLGKPACPAGLVAVASTQFGEPGPLYSACIKWHRWVVGEINKLDPQVVIVSQEDEYATPRTDQSPAKSFTPPAWKHGLDALFYSISKPGREIDVLGNIPMLSQSGPACLADHANYPLDCSTSRRASTLPLNATEKAAATDWRDRYIDPTKWFCSTRCTAIIGNYDVYLDRWHVTNTYATYLEKSLRDSLDLGAVQTQLKQ